MPPQMYPGSGRDPAPPPPPPPTVGIPPIQIPAGPVADPARSATGLAEAIQQQAPALGALYPSSIPWLQQADPAFDAWYRAPIRDVVHFLRLDDPQQVMAVATPLEIGPMSGGALSALQRRFPHLLEAMERYRGFPQGSMARTLLRDDLQMQMPPSMRIWTPGSDLYQLKPEVQGRLAAFFDLQRAQSGTQADWDQTIERILPAFDGDIELARRWLGVWSAISPKVFVGQNTKLAVNAWLWNLEHPGRLLSLASEAQMHAPFGLFANKYQNINLALQGEPLSGEKIQAMWDFLMGQERLPIDVRIGRGIGSTAKDFGIAAETTGLKEFFRTTEGLAKGRAGSPGLQAHDVYDRYMQALYDAIRGFDPKANIHNIFGTTWEGIGRALGQKSEGSLVDILERKGLLRAGALLDKRLLRKVLQTGGWSAASIVGLLDAIDQSAAAEQR